MLLREVALLFLWSDGVPEPLGWLWFLESCLVLTSSLKLLFWRVSLVVK